MANLQSILITNGIALVLLLGLFVTSHMTRERRGVSDRMFTGMIITCAACCICEPITWVVDGHPGALMRALNIFGNSVCYLATNVIAYLWVLYVDLRLTKAEHVTRWYPGLAIPAGLLSLAVLANVFGQFMFSVDAANVYARKPLGYTNYIMLLTCLFYSIYLRQKIKRQRGEVRFFPIWMFLVPIIAGAVIQALMFGVSLGWPSTAVGLVLIFMSQQNELSYLDSLTSLYNRTYLDYAIQAMQRSRTPGGGIMIDVDFFKSINDTYGHSMGDDALVHAARILTEAAPDGAITIRFAGDEFIMLVKTSDEAEVERVEDDIRARVAAFNARGLAPYELSLSLGHSAFIADTDTADSFLQRIDERMYEEKRAKHAERE